MKERILEILNEKMLDHYPLGILPEGEFDNIAEKILSIFEWMDLNENEPPENINLLVKNPNSLIYLAEWDKKKKRFIPQCEEFLGGDYACGMLWKLVI